MINQHIDGLSGVKRKTIADYRRYFTRDIGLIQAGARCVLTTRQDR